MALTSLRNRVAGNLADLAADSETQGLTKVCFWVIGAQSAENDIFHFIKSGSWGSVQNGGVGSGTKDTLVFVMLYGTYQILEQHSNPPIEANFNTAFNNARTAKKLSEYGYDTNGAAYNVQKAVRMLMKA